MTRMMKTRSSIVATALSVLFAITCDTKYVQASSVGTITSIFSPNPIIERPDHQIDADPFASLLLESSSSSSQHSMNSLAVTYTSLIYDGIVSGSNSATPTIFGPALTDWSTNMIFPRFNPQWGTLAAMYIAWTCNATTQFTAQSTGGGANTGTLVTTIAVTAVTPLQAQFGTFSTKVPQDAINYQVDQGQTWSSPSYFRSSGKSTTYTVSANSNVTNEFLGTSPITIPVTVGAVATLVNIGGTGRGTQVTQALLTATIKYLYDATTGSATPPPTTKPPTTAPTTQTPTTLAPTTQAPTTLAPTTLAPTTLPPTTLPPTTLPPTTLPPTTLPPTTLPPTTLPPTTLPTTLPPTTLPPTTLPTTKAPTTLSPTTAAPTTAAPTQPPSVTTTFGPPGYTCSCTCTAPTPPTCAPKAETPAMFQQVHEQITNHQQMHINANKAQVADTVDMESETQAQVDTSSSRHHIQRLMQQRAARLSHANTNI